MKSQTSAEDNDKNVAFEKATSVKTSSPSKSESLPEQALTFKNLGQPEKELLQLIGQFLEGLGLRRSLDALLSETGIVMESAEANHLRSLIIKGSWTEALQSLDNMRQLMTNQSTIEADLEHMRLSILEEQFAEFARCGRITAAMKCLRDNFHKGDSKDIVRLKRLSWLLLNNHSKTSKDVQTKNLRARQNLMRELQGFFDPQVMLPTQRLQVLINQAIQFQSSRCLFHVMSDKELLEDQSLLIDHRCSELDFPCHEVQCVTEHRDEVWFCKFSHSGELLATGSRDGTMILWDVNPMTLQIEMRKAFPDHNAGVAWISWSPDDKYILCCGSEECKEVTIWRVQDGKLYTKFSKGQDDRFTTGGWFSNNKKFAAGGINGRFFSVDMETSHIEEWEGVRVQSMQILSDDTILIADTQKRIRGFKFENFACVDLFSEENGIITFTVNENEDMILTNVVGQGVHLWDLKGRCLIGRFKGITQGTFLNHSSFGGKNGAFMASGSEDNRICIWKPGRSDPICFLVGHTHPVNCVSWNPKYTNMIASSSDDGTVRIWGPKRFVSNA